MPCRHSLGYALGGSVALEAPESDSHQARTPEIGLEKLWEPHFPLPPSAAAEHASLRALLVLLTTQLALSLFGLIEFLRANLNR
jgi:hypothetical protein